MTGPLVELVTFPDLPEVREWCGVAVSTMDDEQLSQVIGAEKELQAAGVVGVPDGYPDQLPSSLAQAILRRVARHLAARGVPLGTTGNDEYGPITIPSYDTEIQRLESPWRAIPVA